MDVARLVAAEEDGERGVLQGLDRFLVSAAEEEEEEKINEKKKKKKK